MDKTRTERLINLHTKVKQNNYQLKKRYINTELLEVYKNKLLELDSQYFEPKIKEFYDSFNWQVVIPERNLMAKNYDEELRYLIEDAILEIDNLLNLKSEKQKLTNSKESENLIRNALLANTKFNNSFFEKYKLICNKIDNSKSEYINESESLLGKTSKYLLDLKGKPLNSKDEASSVNKNNEINNRAIIAMIKDSRIKSEEKISKLLNKIKNMKLISKFLAYIIFGLLILSVTLICLILFL